MKSNLYNIILVILVFVIPFSACKKFLDANPNNGVAVPTSLSDLQALLDNSGVMNRQTTPNFGESSADDFYLTADRYNSISVEWQKIYTWQRGDYNYGNDWSAGYAVIYLSNYCLDQIKAIEKTNANTSSWGNVYGSALFYRSYNFLNLLWVYSKVYNETTASTDLGIALRLSSDFNIPSSRASVKECYEQVLADTKEAINYLPDLPLTVMRPSKAAAYGLLARAYLSMGIYDSAYNYAGKSLALKSELMDFNNDPNLSISVDVPFKAFNKEIVFYTEINGIEGIFRPTYASIDTILYTQYENADLRKQAFFRSVAGNFRFKGSYSGNAQCFSGIATDELYMIKAECAARMEKIEEAMLNLNNVLRKRWNKNFSFSEKIAGNKNDALILIRTERRKELLIRGLRWPDIKRYNKEGAEIVLKRKVGEQIFTLPPNSPYYALPLPADVIRETGMEQN